MGMCPGERDAGKRIKKSDCASLCWSSSCPMNRMKQLLGVWTPSWGEEQLHGYGLFGLCLCCPAPACLLLLLPKCPEPFWSQERPHLSPPALAIITQLVPSCCTCSCNIHFAIPSPHLRLIKPRFPAPAVFGDAGAVPWAHGLFLAYLRGGLFCAGGSWAGGGSSRAMKGVRGRLGGTVRVPVPSTGPGDSWERRKVGLNTSGSQSRSATGTHRTGRAQLPCATHGIGQSKSHPWFAPGVGTSSWWPWLCGTPVSPAVAKGAVPESSPQARTSTLIVLSGAAA